ncbi:MAG: Mur ligase family protein [Verrucomicrobiota bacterium]
MKIIRISVMRGPNYWSGRRHKLISMVMDLEGAADLSPDEWERVRAEGLKMFPSMAKSRGAGQNGGLPQGSEDGILMGFLVMDIALGIQALAGMDAGYGSVIDCGDTGICNVVFGYHEEGVGAYAAAASVRIAEAIVANEFYDWSADVERLRELGELERLGPGIRDIADEADRRGIPWFELSRNSMLQLGYGANQQRIQFSATRGWGSVGDGPEGDGDAPVASQEPAPLDEAIGEPASSLLDRLYPPGSDSRIPIISVTGTNGKTTTTRLIAHLFRMSGRSVGHAITDGIFIQDRLMVEGDCAGPQSAEFVLKDPTVDVAVLETARGGLLRSGLGYPHCDIGIVTNVEEDHLGLNWINDIGQMAKLKAVVPESVRIGGYAILNADDELVYGMGDKLRCNVALFSMDESNPRIRQHVKEGRISTIYESGYITVCAGEDRLRVVKAVDVPLTMGGRAVFMVQNVLAAVTAAYVSGIGIEDIAAALRAFFPSVAQTPGRLNLFEFREFTLLLDFAHNAAGFKALRQLVERMDGKPKVGIIAGLGDRRRKDNMDIGRIAAGMFDEIIIRQDKDLRGKTEEEIVAMVLEGIAQVQPGMPLKVISSEEDAITYAIRSASKGSLLVVCAGFVPGALEWVMKLKKEDGEPASPQPTVVPPGA